MSRRKRGPPQPSQDKPPSAPRTAGRAPRAVAPTAAATTDPALEIAIVLGCVALAVWVERRALAGFFSLDDLVIMEETLGLRAMAPTLWRFLSRTVYFAATVPLFGAHAFPYHLVSMLVHAADLALLYAWVRSRSGTVLTAALAAGIFGATRLHLTALGSVATIGEPLALAFTLGAFLLNDRGARGRIAALLLFACALLSKESVVLLPLVLLLPKPDAPPFRVRLWRSAPLIGLGALFAALLMITGAGSAQLGGEAYQRGFGANLFLNLMTYTRWAADLGDPFPGQVSAIATTSWPVGIAAVIALGVLAWFARRAAFPPLLGLAWWLLALAPVLPLLHHTYLYYLYVPFAGVAMALAGAAGAVEAWAAARRAGWLPIVRGVAVALVIAHGLHADRLLAIRYAAHMPGTGIPIDPDLRKSEMARHAAEAVAKELAGRHERVAFMLPAAFSQVYSTATGALESNRTDSTGYSMLSGALDGGPGLRALVPNADTVAFLDGWRPGLGAFEMFSQSSDGTVFRLGRGADGFAATAEALISADHPVAARELLEGALGEFPDSAPLRYQHARWFYFAGDSAAMRGELNELVRRAPNHPLAARVRAGMPGVSRPK
jgi:hypothetical protein